MRKTWLFLTLSLSSCTVGPDYKKTSVFEDAQIASTLNLKNGGLQIGKDWYKAFHDENLNLLIDKALNSNTNVLSALDNLRMARTSAQIAKAEYLPLFNATAGYEYTKASKNIGPTADTDYFSLGFDASWEIDLWGKGRRLNEEKKAQFKGALYSLHNVQNLITAEVANTYFNLQTLRRQRQIALDNIALQNDIFKTIESKYQSGIADESAYRQSAYLLEKTKALVFGLEQQIKAQENALAVLTGNLATTTENMYQTKHNPVLRVHNYPLKNLTDLPIDIIRTRPDVRAAEQALVAQNAAIGEALADLYPNISISALFGWQANNISDLIKPSSKAYGYTPSAVLPLFHWGALENAAELEREKMGQTYQNYRQTILQSVEELANSITNLRKEYLSNHAKQNAFYNMQKAYLAMKEKFNSGIIEYASLLEIQQDLLEAETDVATSNGAIYQKIIAFYKATGGGYNNEN